MDRRHREEGATLTEALLSAVAEAVFGYLLQEADLADRGRAVLGVDPERKAFKPPGRRGAAGHRGAHAERA